MGIRMYTMPTCRASMSLPDGFVPSNLWKPVEFSGVSAFDGSKVWSDGTNIYLDWNLSSYKLNGRTWEPITWSLPESTSSSTTMVPFRGYSNVAYVCVYYSSSNIKTYKLNPGSTTITSDMEVTVLNGIHIASPFDVWHGQYSGSWGFFIHKYHAVGTNVFDSVYYSDYKWTNTNTLTNVNFTKAGSGYMQITSGCPIWRDPNNVVRASVDGTMYKLESNNWVVDSTWKYSVEPIHGVWTDGTNYYSLDPSEDKIVKLNFDTGKEEAVDWYRPAGITDDYNWCQLMGGSYDTCNVWTDGTDLYVSDKTYGNYVMSVVTDIKPAYKKINGVWVKQDLFEKQNGVWTQVSYK